MIEWFKRFLTLIRLYEVDRRAIDLRVSLLEKELAQTKAKLAGLQQILKDSTDVAVDIDLAMGLNTVIVIGRYRKADYIQTYQLRADTLGDLVDHLRDLERRATVRRVDTMPMFKAEIFKELRR